MTTTFLLLLLVAQQRANAKALQPSPEVKAFIEDSRELTAARRNELQAMLGLARRGNNGQQMQIIQAELKDLNDGKLMPAPMTLPLEKGKIGSVDTKTKVAVLERYDETKALLEVRYKVPTVSLSTGSKPKVVTKNEDKLVRMVLQDWRLENKTNIVSLPPVIQVIFVGNDLTPGVLTPFDLADTQKYLNRREWFVRP